MRKKVKAVAADSIYATNENRKYCTSHGISTSFLRKGKAARDEQQRKQLRSELSKERATRLEGSFGTQKQHYSLAKVKARNQKTEIHMFEKMREELHSFYLHGDAERSRAIAERCFPIMDARYTVGMSVLSQKCLQYDVICEEFEPTVFRHTPYFYETGVLTSLSDGAFSAKGHRFTQANGWVFTRNQHLFGVRS